MTRCLTVFAVLAATGSARAGFIVDSWGLGASVQLAGASTGNVASNYTIQNPLDLTLSAPFSNSVAAFTYAFGWTPSIGEFDMSAHVGCEGGSQHPVCGGDNQVYFHTNTDVLLSVDAAWSYNMPGGDRETQFRITAGNLSPFNLLMNDHHAALTVLGDPPIGTFVVQDSVILPAGGSYFFRSIMDFDSFSGSPTALSIGDGHAYFTLSEAPEPSTAVLLVAGYLMLARRRYWRR